VLTLSNGVEVWLKPTDFKNDQVLLSGYARGGTSTSPDASYFDTALSASLVNLAGVGGMQPPEIRLAARRQGGQHLAVHRHERPRDPRR
jgi:zinc protease